MNKFRFLEWEIYRSAKELLRLIFKIIKRLPKEYRFEIGSQIIRSAFSVSLNIAEGSGKNSDRELNRFLDIAVGSINETLAGVDILQDNQFIDTQEFEEVRTKLLSIASQIGGFKKRLVISHKS